MKHVLIIGGGINGAAIARELTLNGVTVTLVEKNDLASGATAYSSRLIHGGLRYLEHGDFALVRESLDERTRLLQLAPHRVKPLRLFIPVENRWGGFWQSAARFLRIPQRKATKPKQRGLYLVRIGLWLYDRFAKSDPLPNRSFHSAASDAAPQGADSYRWWCAYSDAQVVYPERMVVDLLTDAKELAAENGCEFQVFTRCEAELKAGLVTLHSVESNGHSTPDNTPEPFPVDAVINATGAWVDRTLTQLNLKKLPLMGPTKGSHLFTRQPDLCRALSERGAYAEAEDGRPVFLLPFLDGVLIGTTDVPFKADPAEAVAESSEIEYLQSVVRKIFPNIELKREELTLHYCGVRPLPRSDSSRPGAIPRGHAFREHEHEGCKIVSVIGGKLTTCRSLAEDAVQELWPLFDSSKETDVLNSRERPLPGGYDYPSDESAAINEIARQTDFDASTVSSVWQLCGSATKNMLSDLNGEERMLVTETTLPRGFVRRIIQQEWVAGLSDLVERRLMLLYEETLTQRTLIELAELICDELNQSNENIATEVANCEQRLREHFGRVVKSE